MAKFETSDQSNHFAISLKKFLQKYGQSDRIETKRTKCHYIVEFHLYISKRQLKDCVQKGLYWRHFEKKMGQDFYRVYFFLPMFLRNKSDNAGLFCCFRLEKIDLRVPWGMYSAIQNLFFSS